MEGVLNIDFSWCDSLMPPPPHDAVSGRKPVLSEKLVKLQTMSAVDIIEGQTLKQDLSICDLVAVCKNAQKNDAK